MGKPIVNQQAGSIENDAIKLSPSLVKPGILDLQWHPEPGMPWDVYNNVVPIAFRGGLWGNAEMQKGAPTIVEVNAIGSGAIARVRYRYPAFSNPDNVLKEPCNDAQIDVVVEIADGPMIRTQLYSSNDVQKAAMNNYWGFRHLVSAFDMGTGVANMADNQWWDGVEHAYFKSGKFTRLPYDGQAIAFYGATGPIQWQRAPASPSAVVVEVRRAPWDPTQGPLNHPPWLEMVSVERDAFQQGDETWFGFGIP